VQTARADNLDNKAFGFNWSHEAHGSFIRGEPWVSLLFESTGKWSLKIYKKKSAFGIPITFEINFTKRYAETIEQAVAMANIILSVELCDEEPKQLLSEDVLVRAAD
jgi:hypothetical protein